jgi:glycosyltransferase involved in cell wall biosynthesis
MNNPKISVITVVKNGMPYLKTCLKSFELQNYSNKEHIIVYSKSNDDTENFLFKNKKKIDILYKDNKSKNKFGSLNQGIKLSTGHIICWLHADDIFYNNKTLSKVIKYFNKKINCVYGNILFCEKNNLLNINRKWISKKFFLNSLKYGWMPPHTSIFIKKKLLKENPYSEEYKISGDYDFILKLFNQSNIKAKFINSFFCIMRSGGDSTNFKNLFIKFKEDVLIAKKFYKNYYLSILLKIIRKMLQINSFQMNIKNSNYLKKLNII